MYISVEEVSTLNQLDLTPVKLLFLNQLEKFKTALLQYSTVIFDFSEDSLFELERILYQNKIKIKKDNSFVDDAGFYLGECAIRMYNGYWETVDPEKMEIRISKEDDSLAFLPRVEIVNYLKKSEQSYLKNAIAYYLTPPKRTKASTLNPRQKLGSINHLIRSKEWYEEQVNKYEDILSKGLDQNYKWERVYNSFSTSCFKLACIQYTLGYPIEDSRKLLEKSIEFKVKYYQHPKAERLKYKNWFSLYQNTLDLFSFSMLAKVKKQSLIHLYQELNDQDRLLDLLIQKELGLTTVSNKINFEKKYELLYTFLKEGKCENTNLMDPFINKWYSKMRGTNWWDTHKPNNGSVYHGYWNFVAALTCKNYSLDISLLKKTKYLPIDLL